MKKLANMKFIAPLLLLVVLIIGISYALFSSSNEFVNEFKTLTYERIIIEEEFNNDWGTKKVYISNREATNTPVIIRVNYNESWTKEDNEGDIKILSNTVNSENIVNKEWTDAFINDFVLGDDGWYYYKKLLNPTESVQILNSISLKDELVSNAIDDYNDAQYELDFNFEAIQATSDAVSSVWGKNVTISGNDVTWNS